MKTKEKLNALKEEVVTLNEKIHELTDEELAQVSGGGPNDSDGPILSSLEGIHKNDVGGRFWYNDILYICSELQCLDSQGHLCYMYVAVGGGSLILVP